MTLPSNMQNSYDWISKIASLFKNVPGNIDNGNIKQLLMSNSSINIVEHFSSLYKIGWQEHINKKYNSELKNKLKSYINYKFTFEMENYVKILSRQKRRNFTKLRISAHHLEIETGRYTNPSTPRSERKCKSCSLNVIGDEKHFLLVCPKFKDDRELMFQNLSEILTINNKSDFQTFYTLMNYYNGDIEVAKIVAKFVDVCFRQTIEQTFQNCQDGK